MTHFLGTHLNRIDAKGRVSIPAFFRGSLRAIDGDTVQLGLILRPSHTHPCIEAWPVSTFHRLARPVATLDPFSEAHDDLAAALFADALPVDADKEGRIVLPELLTAHAGVSAAVVFMGLGQIFQIWEPEAAERRRAAAREAARRVRLPGPAVADAAP